MTEINKDMTIGDILDAREIQLLFSLKWVCIAWVARLRAAKQ